MKHPLLFPGLIFMVSLHSTGCSTPPIHASLISAEKTVWIEEANGAGLHYCVSSNENGRTDPTCYPAKRGTVTQNISPAPGKETLQDPQGRNPSSGGLEESKTMIKIPAH